MFRMGDPTQEKSQFRDDAIATFGKMLISSRPCILLFSRQTRKTDKVLE